MLPFASSIKESATDVVVDSTVTEEPFTVRLPVMVVLPSTCKSPAVSSPNSV